VISDAGSPASLPAALQRLDPPSRELILLVYYRGYTACSASRPAPPDPDTRLLAALRALSPSCGPLPEPMTSLTAATGRQALLKADPRFAACSRRSGSRWPAGLVPAWQPDRRAGQPFHLAAEGGTLAELTSKAHQDKRHPRSESPVG
jgi:hypothetical protein